jgi:hypothetical protein
MTPDNPHPQPVDNSSPLRQAKGRTSPGPRGAHRRRPHVATSSLCRESPGLRRQPSAITSASPRHSDSPRLSVAPATTDLGDHGCADVDGQRHATARTAPLLPTGGVVTESPATLGDVPAPVPEGHADRANGGLSRRMSPCHSADGWSPIHAHPDTQCGLCAALFRSRHRHPTVRGHVTAYGRHVPAYAYHRSSLCRGSSWSRPPESSATGCHGCPGRQHARPGPSCRGPERGAGSGDCRTARGESRRRPEPMPEVWSGGGSAAYRPARRG